MSTSSPPSGFMGPEVGHSICFTWPGDPPSGAGDNYFLGLWHPYRSIRVEWSVDSRIPHTVRSGSNWFLASAASPVHPPGTGLVHYSATATFAVAFRGYIFPDIHSYSPDNVLIRYWQHHLFEEHNGIFSAAVIGDSGRTLTLLTDALGIGTLYYRTLGELILFSTNPRYLSTSDNRPDLLAWRSLLQTSWIVGDRSLDAGIRRVPAGGTVRASGQGIRVIQWFDFAALPGGEEPVGPHAIDAVEEAFVQAVRRCVSLHSTGKSILPLSSGFDSRRILTSFLREKVEFRAITCRVLQKGYRDLDATFAHAIASDLGFSHQIVQTETVEQYIQDDEARRILVDGETYDHTWALRVMAALPDEPSLFFDGIGGDILGNPVGWNVHLGLSAAHRSNAEEVRAIANLSITKAFDSILNPQHWPDKDVLRNELEEYLRLFCPRPNIAELAFLLLRQRRGIALWSQQLLPPGYIAVYPYFDLDYLKLLLGFRSEDKLATNFQRSCLRKYWPALYKYPGTRDIPPDFPPGSPRLHQERDQRCYSAMCETLAKKRQMQLVENLLNVRGRFALRCSQWNPLIGSRGFWYLIRLMELTWRQAVRKPCWRLSDR